MYCNFIIYRKEEKGDRELNTRLYYEFRLQEKTGEWRMHAIRQIVQEKEGTEGIHDAFHQ